MTVPTIELSLLKPQDGDDSKNYLETSLGGSLDIIDALFNTVTGHDHSGAHKGAPITRANALTVTNGLTISTGLITASGGSIQVPNNVPYLTKDTGGGTRNIVQMDSGNSMLHWNGPNGQRWVNSSNTVQLMSLSEAGQLTLNASGLTVAGGITGASYSGGPVTGSSLTATSGGASITGTATINTINVNSGGITVSAGGLNVASGAFSTNTGGGSATVAGKNILAAMPNASDWKVDYGTNSFTVSSGGSPNQSVSFNITFGATPFVIASLAGATGSQGQAAAYAPTIIHNQSTTGFQVDFDGNGTGSNQTMSVSWIAIGH